MKLMSAWLANDIVGYESMYKKEKGTGNSLHFKAWN